MSLTTPPLQSPINQAQNIIHYQTHPPAPPPKQSGTSTPSSRGPPLPPHPHNFTQSEPSELSAEQTPSSQASGHARSAIPPIEANWLPQVLSDKSTSNLHSIISDPSLQAAFLNDPATSHPAIAASQAAVDPLIENNLSLATALGALESRLASQRASTQSRLLALRALEQQHRTKIAETEDALRSFSPMALYQRLNASMTEQEQLLRGLEESWIEEPGLANEREVGEWIRRVKDASRTAYLKREKKARWDEGRVGGWR